MDRTEKAISIYCALLIALLMCSSKLLAGHHKLAMRLWRYDVLEIAVQFLLVFAFCYLLFYLNLDQRSALGRLRTKRKAIYIVANIILVLILMLTGGILQRRLFIGNHLFFRAFWFGNILRFTSSSLFVAILTNLILLRRASRRKDQVNEQLRTAYLEAELEILKEQINPHFFFNALSSLSGTISENASLAQEYVSHLSKVFRYALTRPGTKLVTVGEELQMLRSYAEVLKLRYEDGLLLHVNVPDAYLDLRLPHLSLQPLLENATKHNVATMKHPLRIGVHTDNGYLVVENNLQPLTVQKENTGIGLYNLNQRYRLLLQTEIQISKAGESFRVSLPLNK